MVSGLQDLQVTQGLRVLGLPEHYTLVYGASPFTRLGVKLDTTLAQDPIRQLPLNPGVMVQLA